MLRVQIRGSNVLWLAGKTRGGTILNTVRAGRKRVRILGQYRQQCRGVKVDEDFVGRAGMRPVKLELTTFDGPPAGSGRDQGTGQ